MRQLKFRAWNGEQMVSPDYISRTGTAWWKENSIPTSSEIVMQFTGLLDKNGKEVYEGDIVQWSDWEEIEIGTISGWYEVKWNLDAAALQFYDPFNNEWYRFDETTFDEVIGNIYENPNLMLLP